MSTVKSSYDVVIVGAGVGGGAQGHRPLDEPRIDAVMGENSN